MEVWYRFGRGRSSGLAGHQAMISIRDLRVDYDRLCAVRDVTFSVAAGEVCGLIGPNGAGKTTVMRAILGLVEPTYGSIEVAGVDMRERPRDGFRSIGFMPDQPPLYDDLTCGEFLDLFAASYGVPPGRRDAVCGVALEQVGLTAKADTLTAELSRGMRQRLMIAKTLLPDPQVIILDEPASGVDPQGRIDLKNMVRDMARRGRAVLVSSHILSELQEFCTSVAIMERGRLVAGGAVGDVARRVMGATVYTARVLAGEDIFRRLLAADARAGAPGEAADGIRFPYSGTPDEAADLLARLVAAGVRVAAFGPRESGLEEMFLKLGARELS